MGEKLRTKVDGFLNRDYVNPNTKCSNCPQPLSSDTAYIGFERTQYGTELKPLGPECARNHAANLNVRISGVFDRTKVDGSTVDDVVPDRALNGAVSNRRQAKIAGNYQETLKGVYEISCRLGISRYQGISYEMRNAWDKGQDLSAERVLEISQYLNARKDKLSITNAKSFYKVLKKMEYTLEACRQYLAGQDSCEKKELDRNHDRKTQWASTGAYDLPGMMRDFLYRAKISDRQLKKYRGTASSMGLQDYFPEEECKRFLTVSNE
ncbi:MAG: hypothetical protein ACRBDL_07615 [Alphaproteobacteria bacterium]